jgi:G3E family GTPase
VTVPLVILGGYLGAGKTTLLNRLLAANPNQRLALLVNDFGAINIDAALIEHRSEKQINLTNGCICCGLSTGFDEAIDDLMQLDPPPERIIVEASGVADVVNLAQYGHHPGLSLDGIIVVADAETVQTKARDRYVSGTVTRQLTGADLIILNKADRIDDARLEEVERWLAELAPDRPVVTAEHCNVPADLLLGLEHRSRSPADEPEHDHSAAWVTWSFESSVKSRADAVNKFVSALPETVLRAKGFFALDDDTVLVFQQVGRQQTLAPAAETAGVTRLVVIGLSGHLDTDNLNALASRWLGG